MCRLTRDGTAEPVSRDQILRHARGQGKINFPCSADHEQDWQPYPVDLYSAICDDHTYIQVSLIPPWEDQREWHRMTRMTRPDCAVMCNLINIHTYIHSYLYIYIYIDYVPPVQHLRGGYKRGLHAFQGGQRRHGRFGEPEEEKGGGAKPLPESQSSRRRFGACFTLTMPESSLNRPSSWGR